MPRPDRTGRSRDAAPKSEPRRERNAAATRARLLDAAEREFGARGFAGARLREIAVGAGVQPALIHHYFVDKNGLYHAVLDRLLLQTSTESLSLLERRPDLEGLVVGFVDLLCDFHAQHQNLLAILRHEAVAGSTVLADVTRERTLPIVQAVTAFIEERQRAGEVRRDVPAREMILAAMALVIFPFAEAHLLEAMFPDAAPRAGEPLARRKRAIVKLLLAGIRPIG